MPQSAIILTNLQVIYLIELFENNSKFIYKNKEIPFRFNIKFNTKYSYKFLYIHFLKNGIKNNSGININSI